MSFFLIKTLTFVSVITLIYIDNGLKVSPIKHQKFNIMNTAKKPATPTNDEKKEQKETAKPVLKVSKPESDEPKVKAKTSVNDRIENAQKFEQLINRREVLKKHQDTYQKFRLADTGFGSAIILENEEGAKLPIRNPEALRDIYPFLQQRIDEALARVDAEILEFEI